MKMDNPILPTDWFLEPVEQHEPYIVYVKPNKSGYIIAINSSAFLSDTAEWVEIDRGYGDKYHHAQGNYFPESIITDSGAYRYKLADGNPVECTTEEIAQQEEVSKSKQTPSQLDAIEAKLTYIAMMTDLTEVL